MSCFCEPAATSLGKGSQMEGRGFPSFPAPICGRGSERDSFALPPPPPPKGSEPFPPPSLDSYQCWEISEIFLLIVETIYLLHTFLSPKGSVRLEALEIELGEIGNHVWMAAIVWFLKELSSFE